MGEPIRAGQLHDRLVRCSQTARACGALRHLESWSHWIEDGDSRFLVRELAHLGRKPAPSAGPAVDPFSPYEQALYVGDLGDAHVALLNKYNVVDGHLLMVTREFKPQQALLSEADLATAVFCLAEDDGLVFFNGGEGAGASQSHRHLQYLPRSLSSEALAPLEPWYLSQETGDSGGLDLPWQHGWQRFESFDAAPDLDALVTGYQRLVRDACLVRSDGSVAPYNLLVTRRWMLLVPRRRAGVDDLSVNALGFAGTLLVRNSQQLVRLRTLGPLALLGKVARPLGA